MKSAKVALASSLALGLFQASCSDGTAPGNQANDRISIVNNVSELRSLVTYYPDSLVPIEGAGVGYPSLGPSLSRRGVSSQSASRAFHLTLIAEVAPPTVNGQVLQATSVAIVGSRAVVGYNMRGASYLGAIEVYDISQERSPVLRSRALFQNSDINAVATDGVNVFAARRPTI